MTQPTLYPLVALALAFAGCGYAPDQVAHKARQEAGMQELSAVDPKLADALARPPAVGDTAADHADPSTSPTLAYLNEALAHPFGQVRDFYATKALTWRSAPDPTALLKRTQAENNSLADAPDAVGLRVLSYNIALLDARIFWGLIPYVRSPLLDERRVLLPELIFSADYDVILLQELWRRDDVPLFAEAAARHDYLPLVSPRRGYDDGLAIFVRRSLVRSDRPLTGFAKAYEAQVPSEYFPGPGMRRGYELVRFCHPQLGRISVFDTHMAAFPSKWPERMQEARELGLAIAQAKEDSTLVLVGGDMNSAPYYPRDSWRDDDDAVSHGWWSNALSYAMLSYYGGLRDLAVMGRSPDDAAADVSAQLDAKLSPDGWPFTTNADTNSLYRDQYDHSEYPARLDHLLGAGNGTSWWVAASRLAFTVPMPLAGELVSEPSDHYGLEVELRVMPLAAADGCESHASGAGAKAPTP